MSDLKLALPEYEPVLKKSDKGLLIKDLVRKKFIVLTPEEWVRQHFLNYLINHLGYSANLIRSEIGLKYSQKQKRADIIVFDSNAKPLILVECKSFEITLSEDTILQASVYQSVMETKYIVLTNGIKHIFLEKSGNSYLPIENIPTAN